jgi:hypothetical protein
MLILGAADAGDEQILRQFRMAEKATPAPCRGRAKQEH